MEKDRLILFNKPYLVLSQFTGGAGQQTLADFVEMPGVYPAGRLDYDSEGLLLLTSWGALQHAIADPRRRLPKTYLVQVEGAPGREVLQTLRRGVRLREGMTRPARAVLIDPPDVWPRTPPIRFRKNIPTAWLELTMSEGRNRQVRRMTAAVGLPTLRLIRIRIGPWQLGDLKPGSWRQVPAPESLEKLA